MLSLTTIRFFPNLEEIPEESRCSTIMKERKEDEGEKCLQVLIVRKWKQITDYNDAPS